MKQRVHAGHLGINACLRRARDIIFGRVWAPNWGSLLNHVLFVLRTVISNLQNLCLCMTYAIVLGRKLEQICSLSMVETILSLLTTRPTVNLLNYQGQSPKVRQLLHTLRSFVKTSSGTTSDIVITKLKHHFARHGIPDVVEAMLVHRMLLEIFAWWENVKYRRKIRIWDC